MEEKLSAFQELLEIMDKLRDECPWDREQTFDSIRPLTIEETYELVDAIIKKDMAGIRKELGDVLLHIVFYSKIASETGEFDISDVIESLNEKLVYRHPHVFAKTKVKNTDEVVQNWEQLKLKEKEGNKSVLDGIPAALPAMIKAHRIQDKARGVGFDWEQRDQIWDKVEEEMQELRSEINSGDEEKIEQEFGDLFFAMINAARLYGINPENALERTNRKFIHRFNYLENKTIKNGRSLKDMSLQEMDVYWNEAKTSETK